MTAKICVLLSPAAGPAGFPRLIHPGAREDLIRIVVQRHASEAEIEALAECLEELGEQPVQRSPIEPVILHGGVLCLLGESDDVRLEGHRLIPLDKDKGLNLDEFLAALAPWKEKLTVSVLPGREIFGAAHAGFAALKECGAALFAASEDDDPQSWSAQLEASGISLRRAPLNTLSDPLPGNGTGGPRLLLADDDAGMRKMWGELCRLHGYAPEFAADGLDVLNLLRQNSYAGLILDLNMPEMNGVEALRRLRTEWPRLPVLIVTGETDPEVLHRVRSLGVIGVLPKAFSTDQFQRALDGFAVVKRGKSSA